MLFPKLKSTFKHKCPRCLEGDLYPDPNSYHLKEMMHMYNHCPECGLNYMPEPGYYYGAMYVSYAFTIAVGVTLYIIDLIFIPDFNALSYIIALSVVLLLLAPYTFRTSRAIWLNLFVKYDPKIREKVLMSVKKDKVN